eukprot:COSAG06_NODE_59197_length_275_cov_0.556818_1_plen_26_part_10
MLGGGMQRRAGDQRGDVRDGALRGWE